MSASNANCDVFDHGAGCTPLVEPQRRDRLWSRRCADMDDSPALARQTRSSIDDRLPGGGELLPAIAVTGFSALGTMAARYDDLAAFKAAALARHP